MSKLLKLIISTLLFGANMAYARSPDELGVLLVQGLTQPNCKKISYMPEQIYNSPAGVRIGAIILDKPQLANKDLDTCTNRPQIQALIEGAFVGEDIKVIEPSAGFYVIPYYDYQVIDSQRWVSIRHKKTYNKYWIKLSESVLVKSYSQDLVQGLDALSEICEDVDKNCKPVSFSVQRDSVKAGNQRQTCYLNAYDIVEKIKSPEGKLYYRAVLAPELVEAWKSLPAIVTVPAYNSRDQWTGFYYFKGCASIDNP